MVVGLPLTLTLRPGWFHGALLTVLILYPVSPDPEPPCVLSTHQGGLGAWSEEAEAEAASLQAAIDQPVLHFQWNMKDYLPLAVQVRARMATC